MAIKIQCIATLVLCSTSVCLSLLECFRVEHSQGRPSALPGEHLHREIKAKPTQSAHCGVRSVSPPRLHCQKQAFPDSLSGSQKFLVLLPSEWQLSSAVTAYSGTDTTFRLLSMGFRRFPTVFRRALCKLPYSGHQAKKSVALFFTKCFVSASETLTLIDQR